MCLRTLVSGASPRLSSGRRALLAEIALVTEELAGEVLHELLHRRAVVDIAGGELDGHDFIEVIEHQMHLEAEEPAHAGLAPCHQAGEGFVPADPTIVAHRKCGRVDIRYNRYWFCVPAGCKKNSRGTNALCCNATNRS
jgi:hypothetical protein